MGYNGDQTVISVQHFTDKSLTEYNFQTEVIDVE